MSSTRITSVSCSDSRGLPTRRCPGEFPAARRLTFFVAIVSFPEEILGWNAYLARAKDPLGVVRGYGRLEKVLTNFSLAQVLPFDEGAADVFDDLRRQRIRIGTMDLRIASIALATGMTVRTRNLVDFPKVPRFHAEDWAQ